MKLQNYTDFYRNILSENVPVKGTPPVRLHGFKF